MAESRYLHHSKLVRETKKDLVLMLILLLLVNEREDFGNVSVAEIRYSLE